MDSTIKVSRLFNELNEINFGEIGLVILGTWLGIFLAHRALPYIAERAPNKLRLYLLGAVPIIRLSLMTMALFWIIPIIFNITFQNFLLIAGGTSVALGFAFKDYVSSLIAGIVAIFEKPYRPGDWVEIDGDYGEVKSVGLRSLSLVTPADDVVTVPNLQLWTRNISNSNDGTQTLMCVANFYVHPNHDGATLRSKLYDVAISSAYLNYSKPVLVIVNALPWATHYKLKAYPFELRNQFQFITDMTIRGKQAIADAGCMEAIVPDIDSRPADTAKSDRRDLIDRA